MADRSARHALEERRRRGQKGLIPYLTAGYPDWDRMDAAVLALSHAGADVLELGVPFSDPLADGPTIQRSSQLALEAGVTLHEILDRVESGRERWRLPVVLMSYANPIVAFGIEAFCRRARAAGVSGVLLSDLPPEELPELWAALHESELGIALLVAPTSGPERIAKLAVSATEFVYCLSRLGVTGQGGPYAKNLAAQVEAARTHTRLPVVVGFGIRSPEDVAQAGAAADGVVIGARIIELLSGDSGPDSIRALAEFATSVRAVLDRIPRESSPSEDEKRNQDSR